MHYVVISFNYFILKIKKNILINKHKYLGVNSKRGEEFRHSTPNAFRIRWKIGNEVSRFNTRFPLAILLCAVYNMRLKKYFKYNLAK